MSPRDVHSVNEIQRLPEIDFQSFQPLFVTFSAQRYDPLQTPSTINIKPLPHHNIQGTSCIKTPPVAAHPPHRETVISLQGALESEVEDAKLEGTPWVRKFHNLPQTVTRRSMTMKRVFLSHVGLK
ncbi:hypothetical protein AGABI2DRAFT_115707 [Agaricus bisporus var. bisporus H97]|uniref:hypothetical protein n=1 Tax=Agaricus bisporus var. bisporus (strain H97 / ATCC MYA-4626 / FGSC 10389) TaxID=936046 RepID=UPI00029F68E7|nr:hypothetical protein AGABI2DRAFT_115707 [Agaricus bisporus var. bisporus H97]EKV50634.1 hypothetical protein AGABI2DRAFT_115707 [Agaricus bisporus var. bisporus H97]